MKKPDKKMIIFAVIFIVILMSSALILSSDLSISGYPAIFSHTKAICNETNFCQDYEIHCEDEKITKMSQITGATVQFSGNWIDPRDETTKNKIC